MLGLEFGVGLGLGIECPLILLLFLFIAKILLCMQETVARRRLYYSHR